MSANDKLKELKSLLAQLGGVVIGYSGGVDSTFLSAVTHQVLGDKMLAVSARSETYPSREAKEAEELAKQLGFRHTFIDTSELGIEGYSDNPPDRCFFCKSELFTKLIEIARKEGLNNVADGTNADDARDYRPGMKAAANLGVRSPLKEAGLTKDDIRALSKEMGLPTWNKPSFACLASRFPYGTKITAERLAMVDQAEEFLHNHGIHQVRVRHYPLRAEDDNKSTAVSGYLARIEVNEQDLPRFLEESFREAVVAKLKEIGYLYVALDLQGYRTGSMNEALGKNKR